MLFLRKEIIMDFEEVKPGHLDFLKQPAHLTNELLLGALQDGVQNVDLPFHDVPLVVQGVVEFEKPLKL